MVGVFLRARPVTLADGIHGGDGLAAASLAWGTPGHRSRPQSGDTQGRALALRLVSATRASVGAGFPSEFLSGIELFVNKKRE